MPEKKGKKKKGRRREREGRREERRGGREKGNISLDLHRTYKQIQLLKEITSLEHHYLGLK